MYYIGYTIIVKFGCIVILRLLFSGVFCGKGFDSEVEGAHTTANV